MTETIEAGNTSTDELRAKVANVKAQNEQPNKSTEQVLLEEFTQKSHVFTPRFVLPFLQAKGLLKNSLRKNLEGLVDASATFHGYNNEPHLINTHKGVLNILTSELEPRNGRLFDRILPAYDPEAIAPAFTELLHNYNTDEYPNLSDDLLKMFAYQLFGNNELKTFFVVHGTGDNAKSTLWNLLENALGKSENDGYASKVDGKTFIDNGKQFNVGLFELDNSRFAFADELKGHVELDGNLIKQLVAGSGSTVKFEGKGGKRQVTANIITPVVMLVNDVPNFKDADQATVARIALIEFTKKFVRNDPTAKDLITQAVAEQAGIFNMIVEAYDPDWQVPARWKTDALALVEEQVQDDDVLYHLAEALRLTVEHTHDTQDKVRRAELHQELRDRYYSIKDADLPTKRELQILLPDNFDIGVNGNDYTKILIK